MRYTIQAKETAFAGIEFRSRLEARWAAFFNALRWSWVYEPLDLGVWSPDFLLRGATSVFVEVKPITAFDSSVADKIDKGMAAWHAKNSCYAEGLLVGLAPFQECSNPHIGWIGEDFGEDSFWWDLARLGIWTENNPKSLMGFCHNSGCYQDRITGGYDENCGGSFPEAEVLAAVDAAWAYACNVTKWRPAASEPESLKNILPRTLAGLRNDHAGPH